MGNDRCRWVRHRLPLLAGGDLGVEERRRVERHMIGCPDCRGLHHQAESALSVLRSVGSLSTTRAEAPSLWPSVARQIRESRHVPARPSLFPREWSRLIPSLWPAMGLALGLGALMVSALARTRDLPRPIATTPPATASVDRKPPARSVPSALPESSGQLAEFVDPIEPPSPLKVDYDLDHGTPIGPIARDVQRSY
ncbi:zf-HC2 domain-containing protein [Tundrisphaera lichenicola]|uniref:zf-HC2 domain-containing protein n=1 Tax=Tundrisphaera lichenicola TaxID=2029860 RepID=UPI003EBAE047